MAGMRKCEGQQRKPSTDGVQAQSTQISQANDYARLAQQPHTHPAPPGPLESTPRGCDAPTRISPMAMFSRTSLLLAYRKRHGDVHTNILATIPLDHPGKDLPHHAAEGARPGK